MQRLCGHYTQDRAERGYEPLHLCLPGLIPENFQLIRLKVQDRYGLIGILYRNAHKSLVLLAHEESMNRIPNDVRLARSILLTSFLL